MPTTRRYVARRRRPLQQRSRRPPKQRRRPVLRGGTRRRRQTMTYRRARGGNNSLYDITPAFTAPLVGGSKEAEEAARVAEEAARVAARVAEEAARAAKDSSSASSDSQIQPVRLNYGDSPNDLSSIELNNSASSNMSDIQALLEEPESESSSYNNDYDSASGSESGSSESSATDLSAIGLNNSDNSSNMSDIQALLEEPEAESSSYDNDYDSASGSESGSDMSGDDSSMSSYGTADSLIINGLNANDLAWIHEGTTLDVDKSKDMATLLKEFQIINDGEYPPVCLLHKANYSEEDVILLAKTVSFWQIPMPLPFFVLCLDPQYQHLLPTLFDRSDEINYPIVAFAQTFHAREDLPSLGERLDAAPKASKSSDLEASNTDLLESLVVQHKYTTGLISSSRSMASSSAASSSSSSMEEASSAASSEDATTTSYNNAYDGENHSESDEDGSMDVDETTLMDVEDDETF